jgi:catechol 2,3-dioxygenase-like lactoylglutathione lyase family enzyme
MARRVVLDQLSIVVSNMEASVAFYRRLGLAVPDNDPAWDDVHRSTPLDGGMDLDLDTVDFAPKWNVGWRGGTGTVFGFRVDSREAVDELYGELTGAGYAGQQPPWDAFWGARYAVVSDPDGNAVGIMSPVDPDRRSAPPD